MTHIVKPCIKCGSTEREEPKKGRILGRCIPCRNTAARKRHANNPATRAKRIGYSRKWAEKNKERLKELQKQWRLQNSARANESALKWRKANPDKVRIFKARWHAVNSEKMKVDHAKWLAANPEKVRAAKQNRRARKEKAGGTFTAEDIRSMLRQQHGKCAVCRVKISDCYHIDHIMPFALGGSNKISNIQLLCPKCNLSKYALHPIVFMQAKGFLL